MMPLSETGVISTTGVVITAPFIGCAFGWCLERAGLGSAPKLAGQFYFTDFTVFKVMFSALVTAMLGAFWLDQVGLLDLSLVYVPETYLVPQAIGGLLFGAGFLIAGLCPGTSCVAAATGRGDGLAVIGGMSIGILAFNVGYTQIADLYNSTPRGAITLDGVMGISRGSAIALVAFLAMAGFVVAERFEIGRRAEPSAGHPGRPWPTGPLAPFTRPIHRVFLAVALVLTLAGVARGSGSLDAQSLARDIELERDHISAPELAGLIIAGDPQLRICDLRSATEFAQMHIPSARHMTLEAIAREPLPRDATIVLYSEGGAHAAQAWVLLRMRGYRHVLFLREGLFEWLARVMEPRLADDATPSERAEFTRAVEQSRFFGGRAREGVPRADVPTGYWTSESQASSPDAGASTQRTAQMVAGIRRRGC